MKRACLLICLIVLNEISCHVTNRVKIPENGTQELHDSSLKEAVSNLDDFEIVSDKRQVYLDDVLLSLSHQNWTLEEEQCVNQIHRMVQGLRNFTLWSVWEWDTQSSEPQGLLFGNKYQLGNFDQCMNPPWLESHKDLQMKYCLADIVLERTDDSHRHRSKKPLSPYQSALDFIEYRPPHTRPLNELTWGVCVPVSCAPNSVEKLLTVMLARSHLGTAGMRARITTEQCQTSGDYREFDGLFYSFVLIMGFLAAVCLVCTYYNCTKQLEPNSRKSQLIKSFCMKENTCSLLKMKKNGLEVLYGIKWLTMCLIVLDHQIGISNSGPISDGRISDQATQSFLGLFVLHDDLFVDTYFLIAGFLTITSLTSFKRLPNLFLIILKRYVRLVVALSVVMFYVASVYPYTGSGPLWNRAVAGDTEPCRKNWWLSLLMLNNYIDSENSCIVISWYIPCDFHCFLITVGLYFVYKRYPKMTLATGGILFVIALILPGIITYIYELAAVQLFTIEFVSNPRASVDFHFMYIKTHTRIASYLVGVIFGFIFVKYKNEGKMNSMSLKWSVLGTVSSLTLMLAIMLYGGSFIWREYQPLESAVYAALNRPAWACGVGLFLMCCTFGRFQLVKAFLSWYPFVPLSRLAYGLYLSHSIIISRNIYVTRNPQHNDYFEILNSAAGVVFWGTLCSLVIWLLVEAPINGLFAYFLKPKIQLELIDENQNATQNSTSNNTGYTGHLRENLPNRIHFASKI